jgi:hypothetical protein
LDEFVRTNDPVSGLLQQGYLIMKVNFSSENRNDEFLSAYPKVSAYPHLLVLDSDGEFLHSQGTGDLEEGKGYNEIAFVNFLEQWMVK